MILQSYSMKGVAVVIHEPFRENIVLNRVSVNKAIANIKSNRAGYATDVFYFRHLAKYEGALVYLDAHTSIDSNDS